MKLKKTLSIALATLLLAVQLPIAALADDQPVDTSTQTTTTTDANIQPEVPAPSTPVPVSDPAPSQTPLPTNTQGPTSPAGADSNQYTFNPATGMWESAQYIWNPVTKQTTPKTDPNYYYNPATGHWDTTKYEYHPESNSYQPVVVQAAAPNVAASDLSSGGLGGGTSSLMDTLAQLFGGSLSNSNTGPNSTNQVGATSSNTGFFDLFSKATINNNLNSQARTGDAAVTGNTNGGSATTGAATVVSNLFNLLNSAWSWSTGGLSTFVANLFGNQTGNLMLNPVSSGSSCGVTVPSCGGQLGSLPVNASNSNTGPNSTNTINAGSDNAVTVNSQASGEINNNLNLLAQSGNAGVTGNTNGGNATSGDAAVDLNILNMINSAIGAGDSFFGVVNVFGNLTGNILFPQGFLDSVAAANGLGGAGGSGASNTNTGPDSNNQVTGTSNNQTNITNNATSGINNNINTAAQSGTAGVTGNTSAGSATTGSAATNTNTFNFAGDLASDNAVLVLVNVLGHWVGAILNLPSTGSSQAALLTGGQTTLSNSGTGPNSSNQVGASSSNTTDINNNSTGTINNNINAGAISGNADISHNTNAGNATSGNANVATNVANFVGSTLNLKHWFGVLMINVFGDWNGSVAVDSPESAATLSPASQNTSGTTGQAKVTSANSSHAGSSGSVGGNSSTKTKVASSHSTTPAQHVLASQQSGDRGPGRPIAIMAIVAAICLLMAGMFASFDRKLSQKA